MGFIIYQDDQFCKFLQRTNPHKTPFNLSPILSQQEKNIWYILAPIIWLIADLISLTKLKTTVENKTGIINTTNQMGLKQDEQSLFRKNPRPTQSINRRYLIAKILYLAEFLLIAYQ